MTAILGANQAAQARVVTHIGLERNEVADRDETIHAPRDLQGVTPDHRKYNFRYI